jgi:hypothetical protein
VRTQFAEPGTELRLPAQAGLQAGLGDVGVLVI